MSHKIESNLFEGTKNLLHSNKAINSIGEFGINGLKDNLKFIDSALNNGSLKHAAKEVFQENGKWSGKKIAGAYITGAAGLRLASGGGLYKDREGNTDIVGIPFI